MKYVRVKVEALIEVDEEFNLQELCLCVAENDKYGEDEIPYLQTDYFRVVDYIDITGEIEEWNISDLEG